MASLNPWYFSRSRSKSPGGRGRERSKSRDARSRKASPAPERSGRSSSKYYHEDPVLLDDDPRLADPRRDKSRTRYDDESADEDIYRGLAKSSKMSSGRYYLSDEEEPPAPYAASASLRRSKSSTSRPSKSYAPDGPVYESERERDRRYSSRNLRPEIAAKSSRYRKYTNPVIDTDEEDEDDDEDDEDVLAYGAKNYYGYPPSRRQRSQSRGRAAKPSDKILYVEDSDESPDYHRSASRSRTRNEPSRYQSRQDAAATFAAAAATAQTPEDYEKYVRQLRKLNPALDPEPLPSSRSKSRRRSKSTANVPAAPELDDDEWAEIPECERPDFVPPPQQQDPTPVGVQQGSAQAGSTGKYSFPRIPGLGALWPGSASQSSAPQPTGVGGGNNPYLAASNQSQRHQPRPQDQVPPPPPPPPAANSGMQYPSIPQSQFMQHQYPHVQHSAPYNHPQSPHHRAASTGAPDSPQRQYASLSAYQYAQVDPDQVKFTPTAAKPSVQVQTKHYAKPAPQTPDISQYLDPKPRLRRSNAARPHSYSFPSPSSHEQMNVPGSFPEPPPPPGSPLVEPHQGIPHKSGSTKQWPSSFGKYLNDGNLDERPQSTSGTKRSNSKKAKKADRDKDKLDKWVKLNRKTDSPESMSMASSKQTQEPVYDPRPDAKSLKSALTAPSRVDAKTLIALLPYLTSDETAILRSEYRNIMRVNGRALNLAKHIGARVTGSFGKACHATALGQWDSEAYWVTIHRANPQRREILIETLVGRSDAEIEKIKSSFRDSYGESLDKCMKNELKPDKFRLAILVALGEPRQADDAPIDQQLIRDDVRALHRALVDGSEMDMLQIILVRGDTHLREVLHVYKSAFKENFAREMINKSRNVVGEILLHIVNGALNRPMRDAILLHQAIAETEPGRDRAELLISRLVRLHWDPEHMEHVKEEYHRRYGRAIERAIKDEILAPNANANGGAGSNSNGGRNTDWVEFCIELVRSSSFHAGDDNAS